MSTFIQKMEELGDDALYPTGFEDAIVGIGYRHPNHLFLVSEDKCLQILRKDMTDEEAVEYFEFNMRQAYVGEKGPVWVEGTLESHDDCDHDWGLMKGGASYKCHKCGRWK